MLSVLSILAFNLLVPRIVLSHLPIESRDYVATDMRFKKIELLAT